MVWDFPFDYPLLPKSSAAEALEWIRQEVERLDRGEGKEMAEFDVQDDETPRAILELRGQSVGGYERGASRSKLFKIWANGKGSANTLDEREARLLARFILEMVGSDG